MKTRFFSGDITADKENEVPFYTLVPSIFLVLRDNETVVSIAFLRWSAGIVISK